MGVEQSKPKRKLADIDREVSLIRSSLRASDRSYSKEKRNYIQENLVKYSNEVSELKGKVKNRQLDSIQKNISQTMREVLTMDSDLDKAAVETDSIVHVKQTGKSASLERPKNNLKSKNQSKSMPSLTSTPNLQDIDNKLKTLKSQIKVALQSEDSTQLRVYQETLKVLATSLELIDVPEFTPIGDKKKKLETILTSQYQIINKSLREIRRNRDIKYLSNLKQKEDIMKELEIIRREIDKFDSLSREALKSGDSATVRDVQQNLKQIKQRLTSVDSIDENTKTLKLQMKDKIVWLAKLITETTLKGSQPDLTKAQADYEEIIKNIASGQSKSENDVKEKLESLQSFTSSIGSLDEENIRKKKQILSNINESLMTLHGKETKISAIGNEVIIPVYERKMLDNFLSAWQKLNNAFQHTILSREIYNDVNRALNEVQNSIGNTRKILEKQQQESNISTSIENISDKLTDSNFHSNGNDESRNNDLAGTSDSLVQFRQAEKPRKEESRFSRINEIKTHVYYIKEKFESSIQKPNLKTKLEDYIRTLEEYVKSDNEVIANSAQILLVDIYEIIKNIDVAMSSSNEKLSICYYTDTILRIEENITKLERTAKNFQADRNDTGYQDTKKLLNEVKEYLNTLDIPIEYTKAISEKQRVSRKIEQIIDQCETESFRREEAYIKDVKKVLDSLKDRVNRFTGPYKGVLYNAIEKDLNKILIDTDANVTNKFVSDEIIKDTERHLKILEQRALKDQSFRQPKKQENTDKMSALKEELQSIRCDIDNTPMNAINIFIGLNSRLDLLKLSLDQLKNLDENIEHQKEIIYNEVETLKNVVEAKIALGQQDINQTSLEEFKKKATEENNRRLTEELDRIELTFGKLKQDIMSFIGTKSDKKYYELDESTMRLIVKMDDLKVDKGTDLYDRKANLLKEIHQYENLLEKRTRETEHIAQFERDIADIENNFSRYAKSIKDLDNLAARISSLKGHLEKTDSNPNLQERRRCCLLKMNELQTRIKTKVNEDILIEENLLQIKCNLEIMKKNITKEDVSLSDLTNKISSVKTELIDMKNLNSINLQQRTNLLKELEALEKSLISKESITKKSATNSPLGNSRKSNKQNKNITEIEQTMGRLKNEIKLFIGTTKEGKFCELDEGINKLIMKLDDMRVNEDNIYHEKKVQLLRELNQYSELLDKRAEDTENLQEYEQILAKIENEGSEYTVSFINDTVNKLDKLEVVDDLNERKLLCLQNFKKLLKGQNTEKTIADLTLSEKMFFDLEKQVNNFSGSTSNSNFNDIEQNLQNLLTNVQKITFSPNNKYNQKRNELLEQIESTKHSFENKAKENTIYEDFMKQLDDIKNRIDSTSNRDSIIKTHNRLKFIQSDVEKSPLKEAMKNELHRKCTLLLQSYSDKINSLPITNYIGSVDFIKDLERQTGETGNLQSYSKNEIEQIIKEMSELERNVEEFNGNENSDEYKNLEEALLKINVRIKKHKELNKIENNKKKQELKEKVVNCLTRLDETIQDFENLEEVDKEVDNLTLKLSNRLKQNDRDQIDEKLISLQVNLGKLNNLNKSLAERKSIIFQKIVGLVNKIKQMSLNSNSEDSGTSI